MDLYTRAIRRFRRLTAVLVVSSTASLSLTIVPSGAAAGEASVISGTVTYNGSEGPVSAARPILVLVWDNVDLDGPPVAGVPVASSPSPFEVEVPAPGDYFLAYVLDTNGDALPNVGDPFRIYFRQFGVPADVIVAPATDLSLDFNDAAALPGVFGTVTYTGTMGPVSDERPLRVDIFREPDLTNRLAQRPRLISNGASYEAILYDSKFHYMQVYVDLDNDGELDPDEPFTIYNNRTFPSGDPLPQDVAEVNISFGDEAQPTPTQVPTPTPTVMPANITGRIEYTGVRGPVSPARPILMFLLPSAAFDAAPVAFALVDTNGGEFVLSAPGPGDYYLGMLLDTNGDSAPAVGDPFEAYNDRSAAPGDPLTAPQSGLSLSFGDASGLPGVAGTVTYTGSLGPVSETSPILVEVFRDADLTDQVDQQGRVLANGGEYMFILLEAGGHYLIAYLDVNNNNGRDAGEPLTIYDGKVTTPGDPVPPIGLMVDLSFGDGAAMTPAPTNTTAPGVTPTPTATPGATLCVGDCDGDGQVTVDEIILGVNIALGEADISACPAFDVDGSGEVTVDELVQAVDNALNGCGATSAAANLEFEEE